MEDQKATKPQVKFDTMKAFAGMGAAAEVLMKAAPNAFTHAIVQRFAFCDVPMRYVGTGNLQAFAFASAVAGLIPKYF